MYLIFTSKIHKFKIVNLFKILKLFTFKSFIGRNKENSDKCIELLFTAY